MNDEFINETMLNILVSQKRYIEAYKIYRRLLNMNILSDPNKYSHLIAEVKKIDPVLTMSREQKGKKAERLSRILANIRRVRLDGKRIYTDKEKMVKDTYNVAAPTTPPQVVKFKSEDIRDRERGKRPLDLLGAIEEITKSSISGIIDLISANFSYTVKSDKAKKIEILQEMLKRIEAIKNHQKRSI